MIALRLEALWWLTRLYLNASPIWLAVLGWEAGHGGGDGLRIALLLLFVISAGCAHMIENDVLDMEPDRVTAPYLPLPAGLLSRELAVRAMVVLAVGAAIFLAAASPNLIVFGASIGLLALSGVGTRIYSAHKSWGAADSLFVGWSMAVSASIAFMVAGHHDLMSGIIAALYGLVYGFTSNTWAALRDLDRDALVSNYTLAVRIGGYRTVLVATGTSMLQYGMAMLLLAVNNLRPLPIAILAVGMSIQLYAAPGTARRFGIPDRGRPQRLADLRLIRFGETMRFAGVISIFSLPAAIMLFVALEVSLTLGTRGYRRRIVDGGLARSIERRSAVTLEATR